MSLSCDLAVLGGGCAGRAAAACAVAAGLDTVVVARRDATIEGARVVTGRGRLAGPGRVRVDRADGSEELKAARIVVATGLRPAPAPALAVDGERILDWRQFAAAPGDAAEVLVVGAGSVGVVLAGQLAQAGRRVHLVEMKPAVLDEVDADLAAAAAAALRAGGVALRLATRAIGAATAEDGVRLRLLDAVTGQEDTLTVPVVVVAAGRRPDTRDLGLETVTVETDRRGHLLTDANQETATPGLYAIGGAVATQRTPTAARREARQAIDHAAGQPSPPVRYHRLTRHCDLQPPLAWVGLSEREARDRGRIARATTATLEGALVKLVIDGESGNLLGGQALGEGAVAIVDELGRTLGRPLPADLAGAQPPLGPLVRQAAASLRDRAS